MKDAAWQVDFDRTLLCMCMILRILEHVTAVTAAQGKCFVETHGASRVASPGFILFFV